MENKTDNIYIYLWEEFNTIYVGRTKNPKSRHYQHRHITTESTYRFSSEHHVEHPKMIIIENDLSLEDGAEREKYWIEYYRSNSSYNVLNKSRGGQTGRTLKYSDDERKERNKQSSRKYYEANREKRIASSKAYNEIHKEEIAAKRKKHRERYKIKKTEEERKAEKKAYNKLYNESHKEEIAAKKRKWYEDHKEKELERSKKYREKHKEKIKEYMVQYRVKNRESLIEKNKKSCKAYYQKNKEKLKLQRELKKN